MAGRYWAKDKRDAINTTITWAIVEAVGLALTFGADNIAQFASHVDLITNSEVKQLSELSSVLGLLTLSIGAIPAAGFASARWNTAYAWKNRGPSDPA